MKALISPAGTDTERRENWAYERRPTLTEARHCHPMESMDKGPRRHRHRLIIG